MFVCLMMRTNGPDDAGGAIAVAALVAVIGIIAFSIKARLAGKAGRRIDTLQTLGRELHFSCRHLVLVDVPVRTFPRRPSGYFLGADRDVIVERASLGGWPKLFGDRDCVICSLGVPWFLEGAYHGRNVVVGDMFYLFRDEQMDIMYRRQDTDPTHFFFDEDTDFTGVAVFWDEPKFPRASLKLRRTLRPKGIHAEGFLGSASFNNKFFVEGPDEEPVKAMLTEAFSDACKANPDYHLEIYESALVLFRPFTLMAQAEMKKALDAATSLADVMDADAELASEGRKEG